MNTIKINHISETPQGYTGIIEFENGNKGWYKNGNYHKEDGPAYIKDDGIKFWDLDGKFIWSSVEKLDLTNQIILSKTKHPKYPLVQVWKVLDKNGLREQLIIPGMEELIIE